jgi:hypothetical protein
MCSFPTISDFRETPPSVKTVFTGSMITFVALATIAAICIWWSTGSILPFEALGVIGTVGMASLLGVITIGTLILVMLAALCLASCVEDKKQKREQTEEAALNEADDAIHILEGVQKDIWKELKASGCSNFKQVDREESIRRSLSVGYRSFRFVPDDTAPRGFVVYTNSLGLYTFDFDVRAASDPADQKNKIRGWANHLTKITF